MLKLLLREVVLWPQGMACGTAPPKPELRMMLPKKESRLKRKKEPFVYHLLLLKKRELGFFKGLSLCSFLSQLKTFFGPLACYYGLYCSMLRCYVKLWAEDLLRRKEADFSERHPMLDGSAKDLVVCKKFPQFDPEWPALDEWKWFMRPSLGLRL